jgi:hypothetical protein
MTGVSQVEPPRVVSVRDLCECVYVRGWVGGWVVSTCVSQYVCSMQHRKLDPLLTHTHVLASHVGGTTIPGGTTLAGQSLSAGPIDLSTERNQEDALAII